MLNILAYKTFLGCFLLGILVSILVTPRLILLARKWGAMDQPGIRKLHRSSTPLWGGVSVFLGMWAPLVFLTFWDNAVTQRVAGQWDFFLALLLAGVAMLGLGILDDKFHLNARWKFSVQIPVALLLVYFGVSFGSITVPGWGSLDLGMWGPPLTVLWIVGVTNALNLIDGIDGLAAGVTVFVAGTNAFIAVLNGNDMLALSMCSLCGACLGFLRYNFSHARIFLGDTGSLFIGITLAVLSVGANAKGTVTASLFVPMLVLGYPIFDTLLAMARRSLLGRSMFTGDRGHIHHRLLAHGLSQQKTVWVLYGISLLFCAVALAAVLNHSRWVAGGVLALTCLSVAGIWSLGYFKYFSPWRLRLERSKYQDVHELAEASKTCLRRASSREEVFQLLQEACAKFGLLALEIVLPDRPAGTGASRRWEFASDPGPAAPEHRPASTPLCEKFFFVETGLALSATYLPAQGEEDLWVEHRILLGVIFDVASQQLSQLAVASRAAPSPAVQTRELLRVVSKCED